MLETARWDSGYCLDRPGVIHYTIEDYLTGAEPFDAIEVTTDIIKGEGMTVLAGLVGADRWKVDWAVRTTGTVAPEMLTQVHESIGVPVDLDTQAWQARMDAHAWQLGLAHIATLAGTSTNKITHALKTHDEAWLRELLIRLDEIYIRAWRQAASA